MEVITEFLNEWWEPITQGLIGSFLFWIIAKYVPVVYEYFYAKYSKRSLEGKKRILAYQISKYRAMILTGEESTRYIVTMIYAVFNDLIKGLVWLTLGLITMSLAPVFGAVGFLGALFYFMKASDGMRPVDTKVDKQEKLAELEAELSTVLASLNKQSQSDT